MKAKKVFPETEESFAIQIGEVIVGFDQWSDSDFDRIIELARSFEQETLFQGDPTHCLIAASIVYVALIEREKKVAH